ncbi:hypothetical protein [Sessilibacter sp. MAH2]
MIQFSPPVVLFFGVGLLFIALAVVRYQRNKPVEEPQGFGQPNKTKTERNYQSVSIVTLPGCCESAKAMNGKMYLLTEAPSLPLPGCTQPDCLCSYKQFADRRQNPDRRNLWELWQQRRNNKNKKPDDRRHVKDRRSGI